MSASISKQMMLRLAADYERLADRAELHTQGTHQNAKQQNPAHREERLGGVLRPDTRKRLASPSALPTEPRQSV